MLAASGLAMALRPTEKIADQGARIDIARMFPEQFADWRAAAGIVPALVSPDVKEKLDAIYDQTLSRTYVNNDGQRIMLSIAYGGDQSGDKTQVHRPEFCYTAQGFQLSNNRESQITTESGVLPHDNNSTHHRRHRPGRRLPRRIAAQQGLHRARHQAPRLALQHRPGGPPVPGPACQQPRFSCTTVT
jgi:EpsI family protein